MDVQECKRVIKSAPEGWTHCNLVNFFLHDGAQWYQWNKCAQLWQLDTFEEYPISLTCRWYFETIASQQTKIEELTKSDIEQQIKGLEDMIGMWKAMNSNYLTIADLQRRIEILRDGSE